MIEVKKQSISETFSIYFDKRMLKILLLGAISGFPWVLIGSSLSLWLKEDGLSRSTIGWAGLIFGVYAFNYLWAPLVDRIKIPFLTNRIGHRRGGRGNIRATLRWLGSRSGNTSRDICGDNGWRGSWYKVHDYLVVIDIKCHSKCRRVRYKPGPGRRRG